MITFLSLLLACGDSETKTTETNTESNKAIVTEQKKPKVDPPRPAQEPLVGGPYPALLVTQAWFWTDENDQTQPGPARLEIWRQTPAGWTKNRVEDPESNVFHKAIPFEDGILTIGAEKALLKKWTFADGKWKSDTLWEKSWGGKFNRLRDIEVGDVDGDGKDELVLATHDAGVIAVANLAKGDDGKILEMDKRADTFVHEIEIGDIDGDGKLEFFATPSDRNQSKKSQSGKVVMYRFDGAEYQRSVVEEYLKTHAKEILVADINGDKQSELFSVLEAQRVGKAIIKPVEFRQYTENKDGTFTPVTIETLEDEQCRFFVPGDFNQDGSVDLIAAGYHSGLWILEQKDGKWSKSLIDKDSSGFEHTSYGADLNKDGQLELYVAADNQGSLNQYVWNSETKSFDKTKLGDIAKNTFTWNIVATEL